MDISARNLKYFSATFFATFLQFFCSFYTTFPILLRYFKLIFRYYSATSPQFFRKFFLSTFQLLFFYFSATFLLFFRNLYYFYLFILIVELFGEGSVVNRAYPF